MLKQSTNHSEVGFVLKVVPYREHDAMVDFLGESSGLIRLILPGFYKQASKQSQLGLEFTKVNYRFNPKKGSLNRIVGGERVDLFVTKRTSMDWMMFVSILVEIVMRFAREDSDNRFYSVLESNLHTNTDVFSVLDGIRKTLDINGIDPHLSSCVMCSSQGVNAFSIEHGGFLCNNHTGNKDSKEFLIALKALFDNKDLRGRIALNTANELLLRVLAYLEYHEEIRLNSLKLYKEMGKI